MSYKVIHFVTIMFVIATATALGWGLTALQIPQTLSTLVLSITSFGKLVKAVMPLFLVEVVVLFLVTYIEPLSMFLPNFFK